MSWIRLDEKKLRNLGGSHDRVRRVYGWNGDPWPRLAIGLFDWDLLTSGATPTVKICCSRKDRGGHWDEMAIPIELIDELRDMLVEYSQLRHGDPSCTGK